jgi:quinoprotein glucose dehydrogenase
MNTGEHAWMVPNGEAPDYVKENPAVKGVDISGWGNPERAPILITKTVLFAGDGPGLFSSTTGAGGNTFRVLDKKTGQKLFEMKLPARETSMPMTYMHGGKQYVVVAIGDSDAGAKRHPAELIALSLGE